MNTTHTSQKSNLALRLGLTAAAAALSAAVLSGLHLAFGVSERAAWLALLALGFTLCMLGMQLERYGWRNPFNLAGSAVGLLLLAVAAAALLGARLPGLPDERATFTALAGLTLVKIVLAAVRDLSAKRLP